MIAMLFDEHSTDPTPIFTVRFRVGYGREEHAIDGTVLSPAINAAIDAANEYLNRFWGNDTTKDGAYMVYWNRDWSASIHLESINQVTVQQLLRSLLTSRPLSDLF